VQHHHHQVNVHYKSNVESERGDHEQHCAATEFELIDQGLQQSVASLEQALHQVRLEQCLLQHQQHNNSNNNRGCVVVVESSTVMFFLFFLFFFLMGFVFCDSYYSMGALCTRFTLIAYTSINC